MALPSEPLVALPLGILQQCNTSMTRSIRSAPEAASPFSGMGSPSTIRAGRPLRVSQSQDNLSVGRVPQPASRNALVQREPVGQLRLDSSPLSLRRDNGEAIPMKGRKMSTLGRLCAALLLGLCAAGVRAEPAQPILTITAGTVTNHFTATELRSRTDLASVQIPPHVDYKVSLTLQAVPLLNLLAAFPLKGFDRLEATATDGFAAQIPLALIEASKSGGSVAWIAVEDPNHPWPKLPGKDAGAGPFYLIWQYPERSQVVNEQWPYMLEKLVAVQSPELRWPQLKVDSALPADAPARLGEDVFVTQCLPCHRLNGGGGSEIGPDLGQPMAATDYMTEAGIRALVRDPKSVRTWPQQQMPAFPPTILPDTDLKALIAYLRQIASQRSR